MTVEDLGLGISERERAKRSGGELKATIDQIYAKAYELGLALCPPEVALLQMRDPSPMSSLKIAMKPIIFQHVRNIFQLRPEKGRLLLDLAEVDIYGKPLKPSEWYDQAEFIFALPNPKAEV